MDFKVERDIEFRPVNINMTFKTKEEMIEFQARMDLSLKEVFGARCSLQEKLSKVMGYPHQCCITGIGLLRKELKKITGIDDLSFKY